MLLFIIKNQVIERADNEIPVRGTVGQKAAFRFYGECWENVQNLTVRYDCGKNNKYEKMLTEKAGELWVQEIPWEAMACPKFFVAVIGDSTTPTTAAEIRTSASGVNGTAEAPMPPSPTVYDEIMAEFEKAVSAIGTIEGALSGAQAAADQAEDSAEAASVSAGEALQYKNAAQQSASAAAASASAAGASEQQAAASADSAVSSKEQAENSAATAVNAAESAEASAASAFQDAADAQAASSQAVVSAESAAQSAQQAQSSAESAAESAQTALESVTNASHVDFEVRDDGHVWMIKTGPAPDDIDFKLTDGRLMAIYGD